MIDPIHRRILVVALIGAIAIASAQTASAQDATPTPSPADPALAARLAAEGRYEGAIAAYLAVIAEGSDDERLDAYLPLARVLLDDGRPDAAVRQLDAYLIGAPATTDVRQAQLLLAEALAADGEHAQALPLYDAYIEGRGVASVYARIGRAQALANLGDATAANREGEAVLAEDLPFDGRLDFILAMAQALEAFDSPLAAFWYGRLANESESPDDEALGLSRSATTDPLGSPAEVWHEVIEQYPQTATAQEIVDSPPDASAPADPYAIGLVYYYARRDAEARAQFEQVLDSETGVAQRARATFRLAVLDERGDQFASAIARYGQVFEIDPTSDLADDGLWWQGRLRETLGLFEDAILSYHTIAKSFPASEWAPDARHRGAYALFQRARYDEAALAFEDIAANFGDDERPRALLWQGKSLAAIGDRDAAAEVWRTAYEEAPDDYYGLRSGVLAGETDGDLEDAAIDAEAIPDWQEIESWLADRGEDAERALRDLAADPHWSRGRALLVLGMRERASAEFDLLLGRAAGDEAELYQIARLTSSNGLIDTSARAATRLLSSAGDDAGSAPEDLWRLAYPAPYAELVREVADEHDVPDILVLAMVRQESFFDPLAGSSAGALGLTQVIPTTGEEIAGALDVDDFEVTQLFRPAISLRFGAYYLGEQLSIGNVYHALAAYNGGPGSSARWQANAGGDVDRFFEAIDFQQTSLYVRLVAENLARYRQLYGGLDAPELPAD